MSNFYAVLMAGGVGSRFWPVSTADFPKQFHDLSGSGRSLLQGTFDRVSGFISPENIIVLTNEKYKHFVIEQLPSLSPKNIISEPAKKDTAPAILYASFKIQQQNPNALVAVMACDHWIGETGYFANDLGKCFDFCSKGYRLVTLGIKPTYPHTGYGYIIQDAEKSVFSKVKQFVEKPNPKKAQILLREGNCFWNSGIFIWSVKSILKAFHEHQPRLYEQLYSSAYNTETEAAFIQKNFPRVDAISIDYAIMEKSDHTFVLEASFSWTDLGDWKALYDKFPKDDFHNVCIGENIIAQNSFRNIIYCEPGNTVAVSNTSDSIIVSYQGKTLICPINKEQTVKQLSEQASSK